MPFRPLNEDHAIQTVGFAVFLKTPLPRTTVEIIRNSPALWRADLPAVEQTQVAEIAANSPMPRPIVTHGVEFSHKRADGSPVWLLRIAGKELGVETTLYTRWEAVWPKARDFLLGALRRISEIEPSVVEVEATSLVFSDIFTVPRSETVDFRGLFRTSALLPEAILRHGNLWHCHTGWFAPSPTRGRILNQLNIDSRAPDRVNAVTGEESLLVEVQIVHNQVAQRGLARPVDKLDAVPLDPDINVEMEEMHRVNKDLMRSLLADEIVTRVGLDQ